MSAKCWYCGGTGKATFVKDSEAEECPNCHGNGETGRCENCGEDEIDGGVCRYCGYIENKTVDVGDELHGILAEALRSQR